MDHRLLELLVCPVCKGPLVLWRESNELACAADHLAYPIRDGLPVMLEGEARGFDPDDPHGHQTPPAPPLAHGPAPSPTTPPLEKASSE